MSIHASTIVSVLTPAGRGAVAVIAVEGARAVAFVERFFRSQSTLNLSDRLAGRIVYGRWGVDAAEDVVVCRRSESVVEVHCHGGRAAPRRIVDDLVAAGAQEQPWTERIVTHEASPIAAAARVKLASAPTLRTAEILLDQYHGALENATREILEAIDRGDDNSSPAAAVKTLLDRAPLGLHLTQPWRVVVAGPPNVGKSSLVNALIGYERAIVFDQPGTTRDVLTALTALEGWPIELADTAGLGRSDDPVEAAGIERATKQAAAADCLLLVLDVSRPWSADDRQLLADWPKAIVVHNKCDLAAAFHAGGAARSFILTSTVTGQGIDFLRQMIVQHLVPDDPPPGAAVPFTDEHRQWLVAAGAALNNGQMVAARDHLLALLSSKWPETADSGTHWRPSVAEPGRVL